MKSPAGLQFFVFFLLSVALSDRFEHFLSTFKKEYDLELKIEGEWKCEVILNNDF